MQQVDATIYYEVELMFLFAEYTLKRYVKTYLAFFGMHILEFMHEYSFSVQLWESLLKQYFSSLSSPQSLKPLHFNEVDTQRPLAHS